MSKHQPHSSTLHLKPLFEDDSSWHLARDAHLAPVFSPSILNYVSLPTNFSLSKSCFAFFINQWSIDFIFNGILEPRKFLYEYLDADQTKTIRGQESKIRSLILLWDFEKLTHSRHLVRTSICFKGFKKKSGGVRIESHPSLPDALHHCPKVFKTIFD